MMQFVNALVDYLKDLVDKETVLELFGQETAIEAALENLKTAYVVSSSFRSPPRIFVDVLRCLHDEQETLPLRNQLGDECRATK